MQYTTHILDMCCEWPSCGAVAEGYASPKMYLFAKSFSLPLNSFLAVCFNLLTDKCMNFVDDNPQCKVDTRNG